MGGGCHYPRLQATVLRAAVGVGVGLAACGTIGDGCRKARAVDHEPADA